MLSLFHRWTSRRDPNTRLDTLLASADPATSIDARMRWLAHLIEWIQPAAPSLFKKSAADKELSPNSRVRYLFQVLDRNREIKQRFVRTLHSIFRDTTALDLFSSIGLPRPGSFWEEVRERLAMRFLPQPPYSGALDELFDRVFHSAHSPEWIEQLDSEIIERLSMLFFNPLQYEDGTPFGHDTRDALLYLVSQISANGLSRAIRIRAENANLRELPFFGLTRSAEELIRVIETDRIEEIIPAANNLRLLLDHCEETVQTAYDHLNDHGVSLSIVFLLERMNAQILRAEMLLDLLVGTETAPSRVPAFLAQLIRENQARHSILALAGKNFALLSRKVAESNAETGDHYIARDFKSYWEMFLSGAGGGIFMGFATVIKFALKQLNLTAFWFGAAAGVNYAANFVAVQFCGATIATKQPASTAATLSESLGSAHHEKGLAQFLDEATHLIRSQVVAVVSNILFIIPTVLLIDMIYVWHHGHHILNPQRAIHEAQHLSILGGTPFFAAFTGVLLWLSSIFAGWADNWFAYRQLRDALAHHRTLVLLLGTTRAQKLALFLQKNIPGLAGNISLGLMLGLIPMFAELLALPLDIRHVTLSTGTLTAAAVRLGANFFHTKTFWLAFAGVVSVGALNIIVSFSLAIFVALRALQIRTPEQRRVYGALLLRFLKNPLPFFIPPTPQKSANDELSIAESGDRKPERENR